MLACVPRERKELICGMLKLKPSSWCVIAGTLIKKDRKRYMKHTSLVRVMPRHGTEAAFRRFII